MVEGARLERVYMGDHIEGSNPSLSAIQFSPMYNVLILCNLFKGSGALTKVRE